MFPNVRLMIVAISASLLAIVCAMTLFMGMFAAFNVTHEPFSASSAGRPPLQIAFADESSAPVADGKPAPFGVRFQVNAPRVPNGPVIVAVPAALDRTAPPDAPAAAMLNPAPDSESSAAPPEDGATAEPPHDAPATDSVQAAKTDDAKTNGAKQDDVTATVKVPAQAPVPEHLTVESPPPRAAPEIRIVAREAENPASVSTSPAPTLARKAIKRRRLAVHLHQSHHFRRPRIHALANNQTSGYMQPNAFAQPNGYTQPNVNAFAQPNGFVQPGFQFAPAAIKPRPAKLRRAARNANGNPASQ